MFWTVLLEKSLESPLGCKEIKPVNPKGDQSWLFIGRTEAKAETPIHWPSNAKNSLIGKNPDAGKDWRQKEKGTIEGEMVGWHHWLYRHEFEQAPEVGDGQGSLACYSPWCGRESNMTEQLNWTEYLSQISIFWLTFLTLFIFSLYLSSFTSILDNSCGFLSEAIIHQDTELLFHEWWLLMGWGTGPEQFSS